MFLPYNYIIENLLIEVHFNFFVEVKLYRKPQSVFFRVLDLLVHQDHQVQMDLPDFKDFLDNLVLQVIVCISMLQSTICVNHFC